MPGVYIPCDHQAGIHWTVLRASQTDGGQTWASQSDCVWCLYQGPCWHIWRCQTHVWHLKWQNKRKVTADTSWWTAKWPLQIRRSKSSGRESSSSIVWIILHWTLLNRIVLGQSNLILLSSWIGNDLVTAVISNSVAPWSRHYILGSTSRHWRSDSMVWCSLREQDAMGPNKNSTAKPVAS